MYIDFDSSAAQATLERMQEKIRQVGHEMLPEQLTAWQHEDMRRQHPKTETPGFFSAETTIYPRSHTYGKAGGTVRRSRMPRARLIRPQPGTSSARPILREALYDKLRERMNKMLSDNLKWETGRKATGGWRSIFRF